MSVTPDVSHVAMWPYVASAAARSENHAATAVLIVVSSATQGAIVGAGVGRGTGLGVDAWVQLLLCTTPHDVDAHGVLVNASPRSTPSSTHQPRSWLKDEAPPNIQTIVVTPEVSHAPMSWSKAEAKRNM